MFGEYCEKIREAWKGYRKGQVGIHQLVPIVVGLVVAGLVTAFSLQILGTIKSGMTAASSEANATGNVITGLGNISSNFGNLGTIAGAVVVIGLLVGGFMYLRGGNR